MLQPAIAALLVAVTAATPHGNARLLQSRASIDGGLEVAIISGFGAVESRPQSNSGHQHPGPSRTLKTKLREWLNIQEESSLASSTASETSETGCSPKALEFIDLFNEYRKELGLDSIPPSDSLCFVSDTHAKDLEENSPDAGMHCGMHSWSDQGSWTPCCFPDARFFDNPDPETLKCSWHKPQELTDYPEVAYENTVYAAGTIGDITPEMALESWKSSESHNALMVNGGNWVDNHFQAVGAGFLGKYAVMWVGEAFDVFGVVQEGGPTSKR